MKKFLLLVVVGIIFATVSVAKASYPTGPVEYSDPTAPPCPHPGPYPGEGSPIGNPPPVPGGPVGPGYWDPQGWGAVGYTFPSGIHGCGPTPIWWTPYVAGDPYPPTPNYQYADNLGEWDIAYDSNLGWRWCWFWWWN